MKICGLVSFYHFPSWKEKAINAKINHFCLCVLAPLSLYSWACCFSIYIIAKHLSYSLSVFPSEQSVSNGGAWQSHVWHSSATALAKIDKRMMCLNNTETCFQRADLFLTLLISLSHTHKLATGWFKADQFELDKIGPFGCLFD